MATPPASERSLIGTALILATALVTLITAMLSLYASWQNGQDIQEIHVSLNSRLTELLQVTRDKARAEGVIEGEEGLSD